MRNEDDQLLEAIDESIAVATGAGCPLQISHLKTQGPRNWGKLDEVFARIAAARKDPPEPKPVVAAKGGKKTPTKRAATKTAAARKTASAAAAKPVPETPPQPAGIDIAFDRYPYTAYQTGLTNLFPVWSRDGSTAEFLQRLDDPKLHLKIRRETMAKVESIGGWDNVMISNVAAPIDAAAEGQRMGALASSMRLEPYGLAVVLLQRSKGNVGMVGFAMSEDNLDRILAHKYGMVCSDGGSYAISGVAKRGHPHPRGLGTFPRVLSRYVRERKALTLTQAINKMTAMPASRIGLKDRGRLAEGAAADIVIFDPATVEDKATYENPFQYPVGIKAVVVNGAVALLDGQRGEKRSGVGVKSV
jgi:N-acyl-D-amino-acid deacylase